MTQLDILAADTKCGIGRHQDCGGCDCRCHVETANLADLETYGTDYGVPPHIARALAGHLRNRVDSLAEACAVAKVVVDLGWRPDGSLVHGATAATWLRAKADTYSTDEQTVRREGLSAAALVYRTIADELRKCAREIGGAA